MNSRRTDVRTAMAETPHHYYVPPPNSYPVVVNLGLFFLALGFVLRINDLAAGAMPIMLGGAMLVLYGAWRWLGNVIGENEAGSYHAQEDRSFRIGMGYFVFAEIMFFAAFLMAMMYVRVIALPALGAFEAQFSPWPDFKGAWPSSGPAGKPFTPLTGSGLPTANALLLLASSAALAWARKGLAGDRRGQMTAGLAIAVVLGVAFLFQQALEYRHAAELGVAVGGIYGSNFYALTGMHALHLLVGLVFLAVIMLRGFHGHLRPESHFGLDAARWYWNLAVVAPGLLVYVYFYLV